MVESAERLHEQDLVRLIRSRYLRDEKKYDAWGAQGKVLAIYETLLAEGFDIRRMTEDGVEFERLANIVFPRSFEFPSPRQFPPPLKSTVLRYYLDLRRSLAAQDLSGAQLLVTALRETASRFGLSRTQVEDILYLR